jgi:DNA-binding MarR family transcriptional regulator
VDENKDADALDLVVDDTRRLLPDVDVIGLPITGRVLRLARHLEARREEVLGAFGLTVADFDVLTTMRRRAGAGSLNVRQLQRSMMLSSGGTTKRLDRLESAGLVERHPDPGDRRGVLIKLSPEGVALVTDALAAITHAENDIVASAIASPRDRDQVARGIRRLLAAQERIGVEVRATPDQPGS